MFFSLRKMMFFLCFIAFGLYGYAAEEQYIGAMKLDRQPITPCSNGVTAKGTELTIVPPGTTWYGIWDAGQIRLPAHMKIMLKAEVEGGDAEFSLQCYGGKMLPKPTRTDRNGKQLQLTWDLDMTESAILSGLWVRLTRRGDKATARILELSVSRRSMSNALDSDTILATPPVHEAKYRCNSDGVMTLFIDGVPVSGQMWAQMCMWSRPEKYINDVMNGTKYSIAAFPFAVDESILTKLYPAGWLSENEYDYNYVDTHARKILTAAPDSKLILMLAIDGTKWWMEKYPESTFMSGKNKLPDYLSEQWLKDSRKIIRQLIAHVQSSDWGKSVIGYELFNGNSMDCNFSLPKDNPRVRRDFQAFLRDKYATDAALRKAWQMPDITLATAAPWVEQVPAGLILEPAKNRHFLDFREFLAGQFRTVFSNFAANIKEATHGRALVGARTGDFLGNFCWSSNWITKGEDSGWLMPLLRDNNFDYFDVQEPYAGRQVNTGSGVPVAPIRALAAYGKALLIQNDVRTHLSEPNIGYGRTPNLSSTINLQRRVFVNAFINGSIPYLWEMNYRYDEEGLLQEYNRQEQIFKNALTEETDRGSVAEAAIVFDPQMRLYMGRDTKNSDPTRWFSVLDFAKHAWPRAGVPFDMIFLDQIPKMSHYKVYVFVNTWNLTEADMKIIEKYVLTDGKSAVFLWADGVIDQDGSFSMKSLEHLTGFKFKLRSSADWKMTALKDLTVLAGVVSPEQVGVLPAQYLDASAPKALDWAYEPGVEVLSGENVRPLARRADGSIGMAMKKQHDSTVFYSASGMLSPSLFRAALKTAGAHSYTDSTAMFMINRSYVGIHADNTENLILRFAQQETLKDLFSGKEYPAAKQHVIPVVAGETYLFARSTNK